MRVLNRQARKRHAGFLPSGKQLHFLEAGRARDAKGAELAAVFLVGAARVGAGHEGDGAGGEVEGVDVVLGEEADAEAWVLGDETRGGGELVGEEFEHSGFAGAVGAYDADAGVELDVEVDV